MTSSRPSPDPQGGDHSPNSRARRSPAPERTRRPTLRDIAERAGVSEAAASFALNGKPGVSEATRERVRAVAAEMNWSPSYAARALSGAGAQTIGLVVARPTQAFGTESFFLRLMAGMQDVLSRRRYGLLLQIVSTLDDEIEVYRTWQAQERVDGVIVVDLRVDDPRPRALVDMGLPAVIAGGPDPADLIASVSVDDAAAMRVMMEHLREGGFDSVVYVSGTPTLGHIARRIASFGEAVAALGFERGQIVPTDFSPAAGASATEAVLRAEARPNALIYDNEVLALAGLGVISRLGLAVPADLGVVTWEDTALCVALNPTLTALRRDPTAFGADAAERLLEVIDGLPARDLAEPLPTLIARESTARGRVVADGVPR